MPKKMSIEPGKLRRETREWLAANTLRDLAGELQNAGEDATELLRAVGELEAVVDGRAVETGCRAAKS